VRKRSGVPDDNRRRCISKSTGRRSFWTVIQFSTTSVNYMAPPYDVISLIHNATRNLYLYKYYNNILLYYRVHGSVSYYFFGNDNNNIQLHIMCTRRRTYGSRRIRKCNNRVWLSAASCVVGIGRHLRQCVCVCVCVCIIVFV